MCVMCLQWPNFTEVPPRKKLKQMTYTHGILSICIIWSAYLSATFSNTILTPHPIIKLQKQDILVNSKSSMIIVPRKLSLNLMAVSTSAVSSHQDSMFRCTRLKSGSWTFYHLVSSVCSCYQRHMVLWLTRRPGGRRLEERFLVSFIKIVWVKTEHSNFPTL